MLTDRCANVKRTQFIRRYILAEYTAVKSVTAVARGRGRQVFAWWLMCVGGIGSGGSGGSIGGWGGNGYNNNNTIVPCSRRAVHSWTRILLLLLLLWYINNMYKTENNYIGLRLRRRRFAWYNRNVSLYA